MVFIDVIYHTNFKFANLRIFNSSCYSFQMYLRDFLNLNITANKQETTLERRSVYSDIYSDDSDNPEENNVKNNDFVVVKVFGRKNTVSLYAGCVTKCFKDGSYQIRFMKRCNDTKDKFLFSTEPEASVNRDEIVAILKQPNLINARGQYVFEELPQKFKLLG